jgi:hypothetical protein
MSTVSACPVARSATIRAVPRLGRVTPAPASAAVIVALPGSSELHPIGVFAIGCACPSSATAVKEKGSPATSDAPSGEITTLVASAPGPT